MIPFASQRALGQDLATHLMNAHDNEILEVAQVRGAIAPDLHGAFSEWEAQAHALTKCENYLYSLSINPDPRQDPLTREQYFDYIDRTEEKLGLTGQPRAVVFHSKYGREHCHVVWSRIDAENEKAVQLAFDHDKLMMVTREFARDHGLELPEGYFKGRDGKNKQLSLYEMHQKRESGLSKEGHREQVTEAWKHSDNAKSFVQALAERGYILATGKRPYVLVDLYGGMNALPKLIDDKTVNTKDIRAFLEKDFPPESLPTVDEARALVEQHRKALEDHTKAENRKDELILLKRAQDERRRKLEQHQKVLKQKQHSARLSLLKKQQTEKATLRSAHATKTRKIKAERYNNRSTGLALFLGRVTGVELVRKKLHQYQDHKRTQAYLQDKEILKQEHNRQRFVVKRQQEMQKFDMQRKLRVLAQVEKREHRALVQSLRREQRVRVRGGQNEMPSLTRVMDQQKSNQQESSRAARNKFNVAATGRRKTNNIDLKKDFARAADSEKSDDEGRGSSDGPKPDSQSKIRRYGRKRGRDNDRDRGR